MLEFERYAKFDVNSLECVQKREAIIEDINLGTPAATFEGTLEEWTMRPDEGLIELHEHMEDPCPVVIDHVVDFLFTNGEAPAMPVQMTEEERDDYKKQLEFKNSWQLDSINTSFTALLDFKSVDRHKNIREFISETDFNKSFEQGLKGDSPDDHSLSHKMQILNCLQEKVDLFNEPDDFEIISNEDLKQDVNTNSI